MSIEKVKAYFKEYGMSGRIQEFEVSSATVDLAAYVRSRLMTGLRYILMNP